MPYCYLLQTREAIRANQKVYKIGRTYDINRRISEYPSGSVLIICIYVDNDIQIEKNLKNKFNDIFINRTDYGTEYFEGNVRKMISIFSLICDQIFEVKPKLVSIKKGKNILEYIKNEVYNNNNKDIYTDFINCNINKNIHGHIIWTELRNSYCDWYRKHIDDNILDLKKVKIFFEENIFEKKVSINKIRGTKKTFFGWSGWTLKINEDIYFIFLSEMTEKNTTHISSAYLYKSFKEWFRKKYIDNNDIPNNRKFCNGIRKYHNIEKSIKFKGKVTCGIKNLTLKNDTIKISIKNKY